MRLYCINNKPIPDAWCDPIALSLIEEGNEYDGELARGIIRGVESDCYRIPAFNKKYHISRFIPLPDTTANELQEANHEAIVNLETVPA